MFLALPGTYHFRNGSANRFLQYYREPPVKIADVFFSIVEIRDTRRPKLLALDDAFEASGCSVVIQV
jgi:hypothetical protein